MNYYEIYDKASGIMIAKGTARECREQLGCSSIDSFYNLANRSRRGINSLYRAVIKRGGETDYPVLGPDTPALSAPLRFSKEEIEHAADRVAQHKDFGRSDALRILREYDNGLGDADDIIDIWEDDIG